MMLSCKTEEELLPINQHIKSSIQRYLGHFENTEVDKINNLYQLVITAIEKPLLEVVLEYTKGNQSRAAKLLGVSRNTLRKLISSYKDIC